MEKTNNTKNIKKAGIITAASIAAAGAAIALSSVNADAAELDPNGQAPAMTDQTETASPLSPEDAKTIADNAKVVADAAEQEVTRAEEALNQAVENKEQAEADYDAAYQAGEEAFQSAVNDAEDRKEGAETQLAEQGRALSEAESAVTDAEHAEAAANQELENADRKVDEARAADPAAGEVQNAENALADAEEALSAAEDDLHSAEAVLDEKQQTVTHAEDGKAQAQKDREERQEELGAATLAAEAAGTERQQAEEDVSKAEQDVMDASVAKIAADEASAAAGAALDAAREDAGRAVDDQIAQLKADEVSKQSELDAAQTALESASENYKQGSLGFINWMLAREGLTAIQRNDLLKAKEKLEQAMEEDLSRFGSAVVTKFPEERNNKVIVLGDESDATNLVNIYKSIQVMKNINELRLADDNYVGAMQRNEAKTNFYFMAITQSATMRGAALLNHSVLAANCENLAFGYSNPNAGWYTQEKQLFNKIKEELGITKITESTVRQIYAEADRRNSTVGHYTNLMYAVDQVMGVGYTDYRRTYGYNASPAASFSRPGSSMEMHLYTIEEFEELFLEYLKTVDTTECQNAYDEAAAQLAAIIAEREALEADRGNAVDKIVADLQQEAQSKQQEAQLAASRLDEAKAAESQAREALETAKAKEAAATEDVSAKRTALSGADEALQKAEAALAEAKADKALAEEAVQAAGVKVESAQAAADEAQAELDQLLMLLDNSTLQTALAQQQEAQVKAEQAKAAHLAAQEALEKAEADYAAAEGAYDAAKEYAARAQALPKFSPELEGVEDAEFSYLNRFIQNLKEVSERLKEAGNRIEEAEAVLSDKQAAASEARVQYAAAYADYLLAKAEADKTAQEVVREESKPQTKPLQFEFVEWTAPSGSSAAPEAAILQSLTAKPEKKADNVNQPVRKDDAKKVKPESAPQEDFGGTILDKNKETQKNNAGLLWGIFGGVVAAGAATGIGVGAKRKKKRGEK